MNANGRKLAVVTGASTGLGLQLARLCAQQGIDLVVAAAEPSIVIAARELAAMGIACTPVRCDLATPAGVATLTAAIECDGRSVDYLFANAGRGLGHAIVNQIDGTVRLIFALIAPMRTRGQGRVLITGCTAGLMPGRLEAVYSGSKAFLDSFAVALGTELQGTGVTVTCLLPGATDTDNVDVAEVAQIGFSTIVGGDAEVVGRVASRPGTAVSDRYF